MTPTTEARRPRLADRGADRPVRPGARARLSLDAVARRAGLHPELIRRFVALGLVDGDRDAEGRLGFPTAPAILARIQRLRTGLCLNYASLGLVIDLLDRIACSRAALRRSG